MWRRLPPSLHSFDGSYCDTPRHDPWQFSRLAWLNPMPRRAWDATHSTRLIRQLISDRMYPMTLAGLESAMRELAR